jgi:hypothetical protein
MFMLEVDEIKIANARKETIIFSILFVIWILFIYYKNALLAHGIFAFWQNTPFALIPTYYSSLNVFQVIFSIGIIPSICGLYILFRYTFRVKSEDTMLIVSLAIIAFGFLLIGLLRLQPALVLLCCCSIAFFGVFYKNTLNYLERTKFDILKRYFIGILILLFIISSVIPSYVIMSSRGHISDDTIKAMEWIESNTNDSSVVLGTPFEGNLITAVAKRKNVMDTNFLLVNDVNTRATDIKAIYNLQTITKAVQLLNYYAIEYIVIDDSSTRYGISELKYADNGCIIKVYDKKIKIYKVNCGVESGELNK